MKKEYLGALIDGIYAIAMTILILELPEIRSGEEFGKIVATLPLAIADYGLSFTLLFSFWYNQRRINELVGIHSRLTLWLNAMALMLICLVPFTASSLYSLGKESSSLFEINTASFADLFFVGIVLAADFCIHLTLWVIHRNHQHEPQLHHHVVRLMQVRRIVTGLVMLIMLLSFALPGPNRIILFVMPILLIFEEEIVKIWHKIRRKRSKKG